MSKGIIEVDIPMSCEDCNFACERTSYNGTNWYCSVDNHMLPDYKPFILIDVQTRSPQCPIKPKTTFLKEANNE